jgi:UDP-2,3-diacylglucosamine pyrophosphatase LpxH
MPSATALPAPGSRRAFLHRGSLLLAGGTLGGLIASAAWTAEKTAAEPPLKIGLLTDVHYADRDPAGTRFYRQSLGKLRQAVQWFNQQQIPLAFELGDLIDAAPDVETEIGYLRAIEAEYAQFAGRRNYVLGNHCVSTLTKEQFLANCGMSAAHYSFDQAGFHFIVLDACYRADGVAYGANNFDWTDTEIPADQRAWLRDDLASTSLPTLVLVHQRLDLDKATPEGKHYAIKSSAAVRQILADSGQVLAVLMGHSHKNAYIELDGIHYCVLRATVEGSGSDQSGYARANLYGDGSIRLSGLHQQASYDWPSGR